ncbi:MAG: efflux RND transporter permease subunit [Planctomycetaceae bacterium]
MSYLSSSTGLLKFESPRQIVQERLTTLEGILPTGIRPQMTPPASIMGQIVIAGIYRQTGPNGGRLVSIDHTGWVAEWIQQTDMPDDVRVWQPRDRHHLDTWEPVAVEAVALRAEESAGEQGTVKGTLRIAGHDYNVVFETPEQQRMALRTIADWVIRPRLLKTTGVAEVFIQGGDRKQYQVLVDPTALLEYDVTLQDVERALRESNINTSGGFAVTGETERPIRILGRLGPDSAVVLEDLEKILRVHQQNRSVLLKQVARVTEGGQFKRGDGSINGSPGVVFTIVKQPHVDTRELTDAIAQAFAEVEGSLTADLIVNTELFRLKNFIDRGFSMSLRP